jgi:pteridine reductase
VGREIVLHLAASGYDCAFTFHTNTDGARSLCEGVEKLGRRCIALRADFRDFPSAPRAVAEEFALVYSRLDVLVNNASIYEPDKEGEAAAAQLADMMNVHAFASLVLTRELAPLMARLGGVVVNMLDLLADKPMPGYLHYCASKAAQQNITLGLARELAPKVRVVGIAPGVVKWPDEMPESQRQAYLKRVPLGKPGHPQDVARLVRFLASEGAYITGQVIRLDGGRALT